MRLSRSRPDLDVAPGERLLAWTTTADGTVIGGTRDAIYLPDRLPWERVAVLVEHEIDALADVFGHRHLGLVVQLLQPRVLLRRDVDRGGNLLARHGVTMRDHIDIVKYHV